MSLSSRIKHLTPAQIAVLQQRLQHQQSAQQNRIPLRPHRHTAPPSFSQERLWFLEQLHPGTSVYNMPVVVHLARPIALDDATRALARLAERHEILRTTFPKVDGRPVQLIADQLHMSVQAVDLLPVHLARRREALAAAVSAVLGPPFELEAGPPWRASLINWSETRQYFVLCLHHIIADGWGLDILSRELSRICDSIVNGVPDELPPLPIQFGDYAYWQRRSADHESRSNSIAYWRAKLAGTAALLDLPTDRPRPGKQSFRGAIQRFRLPAALSTAIEQFARQAEALPFMVLLATFDVLLMHLSGAEDIAVGTPVANRTRSETEGLIGLFMNTLVLRTSLRGQPSFRELLARVRQDCIEAYAHQDVPFERLVEILSPVRSLAYSPLFQVMFTLRTPDTTVILPDTSAEGAMLKPGGEDDPITDLDLDLSTSRVDLMVGLERRQSGFHGCVEFSTDLFDRTTIERIIDIYKFLLEAVVNDPTRRITELPVIDPELLASWNATSAVYAQSTLPDLFAEQVALSPSATAVVFGTVSLTFAELASRAEQLCLRLRAAKITRGAVVVICLPRSTELIVALLGTLKAGAAYLPVDSDMPVERLRFMLEDARPAAVITAGTVGLPEPLRTLETIIDIESSANEAASVYKTIPADHGPVPDDLAYVIFTSGSTGRPKGVAITHRAACNRLLWMIDEFDFSSADRIAQKTPITFDVSVWELFAPLLCGACLFLMEPGAHRDPNEVARFIRAHKITVLHFVPSMLRAFLSMRDVEGCHSLRQVICSGEVLTSDLAERFFARLNVALANLYGPTETAVDITFWRCSRSWADPLVPIGRPVANCQAHILDRYMQPVPIGATGELYLGGVQVAAGYICRAGLTAERFIADPFSHYPGVRLYRTGDLARYRADGAIEFLGRGDFQVKIRGCRVELEEIEAVLREHASIRDAVVVLRNDAEPQIAAFIAADEGTVTADELRAFMVPLLPEYAIPVSIDFLQALPLTASGKLDRRALPKPRPLTARSSTDPTTSTELKLSQIWREVLSVDRVGVEANFFELGGHSLLAAQVLARITDCFAIELPLRRLFELPTIAQLAHALDRELGAQAGPFESRALTRRRTRQLLEKLEALTPQDVDSWLLRLLDEEKRMRLPQAPGLTRRIARDLLDRLESLLDVEVDAALAHLLADIREGEWAELSAISDATPLANVPIRRPDDALGTNDAEPVALIESRSRGDYGDAAVFVHVFAHFVFSLAARAAAAQALGTDARIAAQTPDLAADWRVFVDEYRRAWLAVDAEALGPQLLGLAGHHLLAAAQLVMSNAYL